MRTEPGIRTGTSGQTVTPAGADRAGSAARRTRLTTDARHGRSTGETDQVRKWLSKPCSTVDGTAARLSPALRTAFLHFRGPAVYTEARAKVRDTHF